VKTFVGYTIWNKVDMIAWLLGGIVNNFPKGTHVGFCFDNCTDDSEAAFDAMRGYWLDRRGFIVHKLAPPVTVGLVGGTNILLDIFMGTDCDICFTPQDDQRIENPVHLDLERLMAAYGPRLGGVGCRDGFYAGYASPVCSRWSTSGLPYAPQRLETGEWAERPYYNDGPVAYPRHLVSAIGKLDAGFGGFYVWCDYGGTAEKAGFKNVILGGEVTHACWGRFTPSKFAVDGVMANNDLARLKDKHPAWR